MTTPASNLSLDLNPSRQFLFLMVVAHVASFVAILLLDITWTWSVLAIAAIAVHAVLAWRDTRWVFQLQRVVVTKEGCRLSWRDGQCDFGPASGYFVSPWLIVLRVSVAGKQRLLPLFGDSADGELLRRLRVILRCSPEIGR